MNDFENKNHYELLRVERDASEEEIKQAFKEIALVYHPDSNFFDEIVPEINSSESDISLFKAITSAYQTLSNKEKRAEYDRVLNGQDLSKGTHYTGSWIRPDGSQPTIKTVPKSRNATVTDLQKMQKQYQERMQNRPPSDSRSMAEMMAEQQKSEKIPMKWIILGGAVLFIMIIIIAAVLLLK
ncbi:MAG TPA: J domain-containing protein [Oligoflexia bacterium]|nr:J domain-containing protein [Oligoflexia bacterium]HMP47632.1 J domain-containing protein [Oligoflexia bacterium]